MHSTDTGMPCSARIRISVNWPRKIVRGHGAEALQDPEARHGRGSESWPRLRGRQHKAIILREALG
jgi:hypothetical protein